MFSFQLFKLITPFPKIMLINKNVTSGQPIFSLKLEDNCQNGQNGGQVCLYLHFGGFRGQNSPMEDVLLNGRHLTPMSTNIGFEGIFRRMLNFKGPS